MVSRAPLTIVVLLGMGVAALVLTGRGWIVPPSFFEPVSAVVSVLSILLMAWELLLWRIPWLHPWPVSRPVLRGTWRGEIQRKGARPITIYLAVRQTYSHIGYRTFTAESRSASITANLSEVDGQFLLAAIYRNEPDLLLQHRSPVHRGAMCLWIGEQFTTSLVGSYWTDRDTKGELRFERVSSTVASDLTAARRLADLADRVAAGSQPPRQRSASG